MVFEQLEESHYSSCYATTSSATDLACTTYGSTSDKTIDTDKALNEFKFGDNSYLLRSNDSNVTTCKSGSNYHQKLRGNEWHLPPAVASLGGRGSRKNDDRTSSSTLMDDWSQLAEATLPLKASGHLMSAATGAGGGNYNSFNDNALSTSYLFQASIESRSREISRKLIYVNVISLIINLSLAIVAFYFSFVNNSSSTTAFAADCVLDFISSAIVLWRYYGDLNSVYMHAREQIACIYLGALFEISAIGIIIKSSSDIANGVGFEEGPVGYDLIYLAVAATTACTILTVFKVSLYNTVRDKSILLDVINTLISTIFAMSIILSQLLISFDLSFWYLDPILSIVLALFMAGFGLKVIHQNFNILRPSQGDTGTSTLAPWLFRNKNASVTGYTDPLMATRQDTNNNFGSNLNGSVEYGRSAAATNWQKADYSSIAFV